MRLWGDGRRVTNGSHDGFLEALKCGRCAGNGAYAVPACDKRVGRRSISCALLLKRAPTRPDIALVAPISKSIVGICGVCASDKVPRIAGMRRMAVVRAWGLRRRRRKGGYVVCLSLGCDCSDRAPLPILPVCSLRGLCSARLPPLPPLMVHGDWRLGALSPQTVPLQYH